MRISDWSSDVCSSDLIGTPAAVNRTVADGVSVRVDVDGLAVFGTAGDSLFDDLAALSSALRAGDGDEIRAGIDILAGRMTDLTNTQVDVGIRQKRLDDVLEIGRAHV